MVKASAAPAAIEGIKIEVRGQKISPVRLPLTLGSSEIVFPISVQKRGQGIITQELNPKQAFFRDYSNLDNGDEISGSDLWGFSSSPVTRINVGQKGRTSSHSGQDVEINGGKCFLQIIKGSLGVAISTHPKNDLVPRITQISSQS